jgi:hypothetical protein
MEDQADKVFLTKSRVLTELALLVVEALQGAELLLVKLVLLMAMGEEVVHPLPEKQVALVGFLEAEEEVGVPH